jgi:HEAT repeat protein
MEPLEGVEAAPLILRDEASEARCAAIAALPPEAIEDHLDALLDLLRDPNWRVRREAALAVARLRSPAAVAPLLAAVCSDDVLARNAALEALRNMGGAAVDAVLARLALAGGPPRRFLIEALLEGADARCVAPLRALLDDADGNILPAAAEVLGVIAGPAALDALGDAAAHRDPVVRLAALIAFEARREVSRWECVAALVDDPVCGAHAVRALATLRDERSMAAVASALASPHRRVVLAALGACARVARARDDRAALLARALRSAESAVFALASRAELGPAAERAAALHALGLAGDPSALDVVLRACAARDAEVATAAEEALDGFSPEAIPAAVARALEHGPSAASAALAWALRRGLDASAAPLAALAWTALDRGDAPPAAWEVLARFGTHDDARVLAERLGRALARSDVDPGAMLPVIERALRRHRSEVEPLLRSFVALTPRGMQVAAALARAGVPLDASRVAEGLDAEDPSTRAGALRALAAAGAGPTGAVVERMRRDASSEVRAALAEAVRAGPADEAVLRALVADVDLDVGLRAAALAALAAHGHASDERLAAALSDPDEELALEALRALDVGAHPAWLVRATAHEHAAVVSEALARLREHDAPAARARAASLLGHASPAVRVAAARCLAGSGAAGRAALVEGLAQERDAAVREALDDALDVPSANVAA